MRKRLILCLLSVLLFASAWLRISGLTVLAAFVPLLIISAGYDSSRRSFWRMFGWTALTFGLQAAATSWWVWYASPAGPIAVVIVQIVLFGGVFMLYHYTSKRVKRSVAYVILVCGWVAAELLYVRGEISFPWILLGNAFANEVWAVQWYEFTGMLGGSVWVWAVNLLLFEIIRKRNRRSVITAATVAAVPVLVSLVMFWTYRQSNEGSVKVAAIQPNIDPWTEKFYISQREQNDVLLGLAAQAPPDTDIFIMPETALDDDIWEESADSAATVMEFKKFLREKYPRAQIIVGATTFVEYPGGYGATETARYNGGVWYDAYNSALSIRAEGETDIYHKINLVIGGEKMPYMKVLKPLEKFILDLGGTTGRLGYNDVASVFALPRDNGDTIVSGAPICYDSVYGDTFGDFTANGAEVMFVITNDGWWHDTPGYKQHFSYSRLRAIETRRAIARSANTGISGFITPRGDVRETLGWDLRGVICDELPLSGKLTFYARYGDYIGRICAYTFALGLLYYIAYRFRRKNLLDD